MVRLIVQQVIEDIFNRGKKSVDKSSNQLSTPAHIMAVSPRLVMPSSGQFFSINVPSR